MRKHQLVYFYSKHFCLQKYEIESTIEFSLYMYIKENTIFYLWRKFGKFSQKNIFINKIQQFILIHSFMLLAYIVIFETISDCLMLYEVVCNQISLFVVILIKETCRINKLSGRISFECLSFYITQCDKMNYFKNNREISTLNFV